jgi:DNA repair protein RecN (Recombination protein N)
VEEGGALLRRVIDNAGRSKAYINGIAATAAQLRELGDLLVDIHGQHAHQSLMKTEAQRDLLDGRRARRGARGGAAYKAWRALARQLEEFEANAANVLYERERLEWQVNELEKLAVKPGEWAEVSNEHSRLSHAASLMEGAQEALAAISESEDHPILSQLSSLNQKLGKLADIDSGLQPIVDLIEPARIQLQEAVYALNDYLDRVDLDPRACAVEARMDAIHSAARNSACRKSCRRNTPSWPSACRRWPTPAISKACAAGGKAQGRYWPRRRNCRPRARAPRSSWARRSRGHAGSEHDGRLRDCAACGRAGGVWPGAGGILVAGHAGVAARPLAKVASGGELARISLAISVITSNATTVPT